MRLPALPLILVLTTLPLLAQRGPGAALRTDGPLMERIHEARLRRIQETLGLPEAQARALADRWSRFDQDFAERAQRMVQLRQQFNAILLGPGNETEKGAQLKPHLDEFVRLRREQQELKTRFEEEIRASLPPAQQVRLILLVDEFQRRLQEGVRETLLERRRNRPFR